MDYATARIPRRHPFDGAMSGGLERTSIPRSDSAGFVAAVNWVTLQGSRNGYGDTEGKALVVHYTKREIAMPYGAVALLPWGSWDSGSGAIQETTGDVDLGNSYPFIAFLSAGYIGGRVGGAATQGPWDYDNAVASEIYAVDGNVLTYIEGWGSRFGSPNAFTNYHSASYQGFGRIVTFRMRIWQPEEMEAITDGIVLYNV